ncbi:hypothetical protein GWK08_06410 [Leptobacterium flavescens]|uniref:Uncharacterized protein n=1 Tax=Leptobacterium flavescens TaxID=472055 RepID=A0A6P0UQA7_9FLAO|nr:hypothetical protein [Leptobacterium flavescens]NER13063.1 hypothetical protein [Leptobacterium flavescens]
MATQLTYNILTVGGIGCLIFMLWILFFSYSGMAKAVRDREGNFTGKLNWKSVLAFSIFIAFLFGIMHFGNVRLINHLGQDPGLWTLWLNSFGIFFTVHLFDLIVLDYLIIVVWHPAFLKLPDTDYYRKLRPHLIGFFKGIPLGIASSFLTAVVFGF